MNFNKIKKYIRKIYLLIITVFIICGFIYINNINAQEISNLPPDLSIESSLQHMPGHIEGENTFFEITNSEYLNLKLNSSEIIKLTFESIPEMVTMMMESSSSTAVTSTQITAA